MYGTEVSLVVTTALLGSYQSSATTTCIVRAHLSKAENITDSNCKKCYFAFPVMIQGGAANTPLDVLQHTYVTRAASLDAIIPPSPEINLVQKMQHCIVVHCPFIYTSRAAFWLKKIYKTCIL
jgi:hypothetical protein